MTVDLLIHAIVHQTTILIAQLATQGGARAPLAQVATQVFLELARELERQGVSRKVSADMFGLGLRTYRRKIQRLSESSTERGRSLWEVVLEFIREHPHATRPQLFLRFSLDDEAQVRAVLRDLCESQLVVADPGPKVSYRAASDDELLALRSAPSGEGQDELLVALMYREGPLTLAQIAQRAQTEEGLIAASIERLVASGRIQRSSEDAVTLYEARALVIPIGASIGWEAAVFDHFKAVTKTILVRLGNKGKASLDDVVGGSTYTIDIWEGHPLADEVRNTLKQMRGTLTDLRERVTTYSETHPTPDEHERVVIYAGQCLIQEGLIQEGLVQDGSDSPA
jgi:hypothetical protein